MTIGSAALASYLLVGFASLFCGIEADASFYARNWYKPTYPASRVRQAFGPSSIASKVGDAFASKSAPSLHHSLTARSNLSVVKRKLDNNILAGTIRVAADALEDYIVGFCLGYAIGFLVGVPSILVRRPNQLSNEIYSRLRRMNRHSIGWGLPTGEFLGTFRGCATAVRLIRAPKRDALNIVYGCASGAAVMARAQGPVGMASSALVVGSVVFFLESTSVRPISRHRENEFSPFRSGNRRSRYL